MSYTFERLSDTVSVAVTKEHTFGTDAVLLAAFAQIRPRDRALDMGTGCGIIPLLWLRDERTAPVHCLELQENAMAQVRASIAHNGLQARLIPHCGDLRQIADVFPAGTFTLVTMNPPYKPAHTGVASQSESALLARHEVACTLEDAVAAAAYALNSGGRFCLCHRPERLTDALTLLRQYRLEPKRLRFVADRAGEKPFLFLLEGKKDAKPFLQVEATLVLRNGENRFSEEMLKIYGSYADGHEDQIR